MVLTSSTRPDALGPIITEWFIDTIEPQTALLGATFHTVSLRDLDLPFLDEEDHPSSGHYRHEHTKEWSRLVDAADGFVIVTPEYNYGMPAALKNALDYLSAEWAWKPVGFVSYGNSSAGTRSVQHAKQVVTTLRLVPLGATIALRISETIEDGRVGKDSRRERAAVTMLAELVRLAHALAPMREFESPTSASGPLPGSYLRPLTSEDAAEIVVLQRCSWVTEAVENDRLDLAPLHETPEDVSGWLAEWSAYGLWRDGRLLGMVRTRTEDRTGHIGRLAVVPDLRGAGLGRWLLNVAEDHLGDACEELELRTGVGSLRNIALYERLGYARAGSAASDGAADGSVRLVKPLARPDAVVCA